MGKLLFMGPNAAKIFLNMISKNDFVYLFVCFVEFFIEG